MPSPKHADDYSGTSGAELLRLSWYQLRHDKELLAFPIMSAILANLVGIGTIGVFLLAGLIDISSTEEGDIPTSVYIAAFAASYASTFVVVFFQVALCAGAMARLDGEDPTIGSCLSVATQRIPQIASWSLIATTVGFVLRMISERVGIIGKFVVAGLSVAWSVATLFVIPIIVADKDGSLTAVTQSKNLVMKKWRDIGAAGIRWGYSFIIMPVIVCVSLILFGAGFAIRHNAPLFFIIAAAGVIGLICVAVVASATGVYLRTVLYRFASGIPTPGIPSGVIAHALPGAADNSTPPAAPGSGGDNAGEGENGR